MRTSSTSLPPPSAHRRLIVWAGAVALAFSAPLLAAPASAETDAMTQEALLTAQSTPAVQMVLATCSTTVTIPDWDLNESAWLAQASVSGTMQGVVDAVAANPAKFIVPASTKRKREVSATYQGTGFVVTPDGYVVTNAHIVARPDAQMRAELSTDFLAETQDSDARSIAASTNAGFTAGQLKQISGALRKLDRQYMKIGGITKDFAVAVGVGIPGLTTGAKTIPADLTLAGTPAPGKDVAIIKVPATNLITVPLGDDTSLNISDRLYVVGYPADAQVSEASLTVPTLTMGAVSARKTLDNGLTVIQTDAAVNPGNSGGPVLDRNGKVVGIATFGTLDSSGVKVSGVNFAYPVSLIRELLGRANVTPSEGVTTPQWVDGLALYNASHVKAALPMFQAVNELVPGAPIVQEYVQKTQRAIAEGKDVPVFTLAVTGATVAGAASSGMTGATWVIALGGLLLVALLIVGLIALSRRGRTSTVTAGATATPTPPPPAVAPVAVALPPAAVPAPPSAPAAAGSTLLETRPAAHGRFCAECGAEHAVDDHFCPDCGHRLI